MILKNDLKFVLFDFDGVIADSLLLKGDCFVNSFDDYPHKAKEILNFHMQNPGINRKNKIRIIAEKIIGLKINNEEMDLRLEKFVKNFNSKFYDISIFKDFSVFLEILHDMVSDLIIISNAPKNEIIKILELHNLFFYFNEIYSVEKSKKDFVEDLIRHKRINPKNTIYLGDSAEDYSAAVSNNITYIHKKSLHDKSDYKDAYTFYNYDSLLKIMKEN